MASVFERLRDALAPEYALERELDSGGMGVVFLARDTSLDRPVAVKIIRPELATARATERFLREAKVLARLTHPNIVPVHRAGEAGGFAYYVMDYFAGETLEQRLQRGPLEPAEVIRLGRDLLDGLEAVHRAGLVHRDIKPGNVFLQGRRAVLGDFGLAMLTEVDATTPTEPRGFQGTPGYVAPEQGSGGVVTPRTDLYAVGIVLYEAITGRLWRSPDPGKPVDWLGVPLALRTVLRRALAPAPERRWSDAAAFRRALWSLRVRPYLRRGLGFTFVGVAAGALAVALVRGRWGTPPVVEAGRSVRVVPFTAAGVPGRALLGDSLARLVASDLHGGPDFMVLGPQDGARRTAAEVAGAVRSGGGILCASAVLRRPSGGRPATLPETCAAADRLGDLADSLARLVLVEIWTGEEPVVADLPRSALPRTQAGLAGWARAERLFAQGRWGEAYLAYREAERADSTCWFCSWRLFWIEKWRGLPHDSVRFRHFLAHVDSFPPEYRSVMRASLLPMAERLDTLRSTAQRYPHFFFAWWFLGEEQFHRGPLVGRSRREAVESFVRATELTPRFAPAWEHLAWVRTAEGDSAGALHAIDAWARAMGGEPRDTFSLQLRALVTAGFAWRFADPAIAEAITRASLLTPEIVASPDLAAGPRLMPTFDAPLGAVWLGAQFAALPDRPHLARSGLLAQVFGYVALGQPDSARARLNELLRRFPEPELALFAAEYAGALGYADPGAVPGWRAATEGALARLARPGATSRDTRERAAWMLALLSGDGRASGGPRAPNALLESARLAQRQRWAEAIARSDPLVADPTLPFADVVLRALVHLGRAEWFARLQNPEAARQELRWAEHSDINGYPTGPPQAAEVDWSLRTLARWRLATTLDRAGVRDEEVCEAYARVAELWWGGAPFYRARADSARWRVAQLSCGSRPS